MNLWKWWLCSPSLCFPDKLSCGTLGGKPSLKADLEFRVRGYRHCVRLSIIHFTHPSICPNTVDTLIFLVQWLSSWALEQASLCQAELRFRLFHWRWVWSWVVNPWRTGSLSITWVRWISALPVKNKLDVCARSLNFVQWLGPIDF